MCFSAHSTTQTSEISCPWIYINTTFCSSCSNTRWLFKRPKCKEFTWSLCSSLRLRAPIWQSFWGRCTTLTSFHFCIQTDTDKWCFRTTKISSAKVTMHCFCTLRHTSNTTSTCTQVWKSFWDCILNTCRRVGSSSKTERYPTSTTCAIVSKTLVSLLDRLASKMALRSVLKVSLKCCRVPFILIVIECQVSSSSSSKSSSKPWMNSMDLSNSSKSNSTFRTSQGLTSKTKNVCFKSRSTDHLKTRSEM